MKPGKLLLLCLLLLSVVLFYQLDFQHWLDLPRLQQSQHQMSLWVTDHPALAIGGYFLLYVVVTALSIPGAIPLSLLAGAMFGVVYGSVLVSFASSLGATLAFTASRYLFREIVNKRFTTQLERINAGLKRDGIAYLLTLRLIPVVPFAAINLAMGLTRMPAAAFYLVSQAGMLPATLIYVNAGTQLAAIRDTSDILSLELLLSLTALGLLPLLASALQRLISRHQQQRGFRKPKHFDRNVIVIGGGAAGLVSALISSGSRASVTLIEKDRMGGDCLNTGCVPSKALIRSARFMADLRRADAFGVRHAEAEFEFSDIMARVQQKIATLAPHDSVEHFQKRGVDCRHGSATVLSPWSVEVNGEIITARTIILATGSRPRLPDIGGIQQIPVLTSENIWQLRTLPPRLLVIGGGAIGCEMSQCFARFGSDVTLLQQSPQLLSREDPDIAQIVAEQLQQDGVQILTEHRPLRFVQVDNEHRLLCSHRGRELQIAFDQVLIATGRTPDLEGLGLEKLGLELSHGELIVNEQLQTSQPSIYACGDVIGPHRFTHAASHQAWFASLNALFGQIKRFSIDYQHLPFTLYTAPEVARIGLNEKMALAGNIDYEVTEYSLTELDRAITDDAARGKVKILTAPGKDRILGVSIVGDSAGDMIAEFALAMKQGIGLSKLASTLHPYPTYSEANRYAAANWRKAHMPESLLVWLERYHRWRR